MKAPAVDIEVDEETGHWFSDGLPMIFTPRHFFMGVVEAMEDAVGHERAQRHLYDAGFRSAEIWCREESRRLGMDGLSVVHFYLRRLSERGWGRFELTAFDKLTGEGTMTLHHSSLVAHHGGNTGQKVCGMCGGWAAGALTAVSAGQFVGEETCCAGAGHSHCEFSIVAKR